jgi:crotonobetainyl-CoA:carnitine CoA-transferase CaiB-like acyl-CoA transferase
MRTGIGQKTWTSLLGCSAMMQCGELVRFDGRPPAVHGGRDFAGPSALDRFYRVNDGWLRLQAPNVECLQAAGLVGAWSSSTSDADVAEALERSLAPKSLAEALACLTAAGIPATVARRPGDLPGDPALRDLEMFATEHMQDGTPFYVTNRYARFSRTQECGVFKAPGIGEHSRDLLAEAGVRSAEVDALIERGAVKQGEAFRVVAIQNYR